MNEFNKISNESSLPIGLSGYPVRMKLIGKDSQGNDSILVRSLLIQEIVKRGIFMHPGVEYISYSHEKIDIQKTINAFVDSIPILKKAINENRVKSYLKGNPVNPVYTLIKSPEKRPSSKNKTSK